MPKDDDSGAIELLSFKSSVTSNEQEANHLENEDFDIEEENEQDEVMLTPGDLIAFAWQISQGMVRWISSNSEIWSWRKLTEIIKLGRMISAFFLPWESFLFWIRKWIASSPFNNHHILASVKVNYWLEINRNQLCDSGKGEKIPRRRLQNLKIQPTCRRGRAWIRIGSNSRLSDSSALSLPGKLKRYLEE